MLYTLINCIVSEKTEKKRTYTSKKNPASLKHLTVTLLGRKLLKLSQCKKTAKPPAEHPESKACRVYMLRLYPNYAT